MKRDFNKIRNILLKFDESEFTEVTEVKTDDEIIDCLYVMSQAGLVNYYPISGKESAYEVGILPEGQIFLELCRNKMIWDKVDTRIQECGLYSVPYEILKEALYDQIKKELMG